MLCSTTKLPTLRAQVAGVRSLQARSGQTRLSIGRPQQHIHTASAATVFHTSNEPATSSREEDGPASNPDATHPPAAKQQNPKSQSSSKPRPKTPFGSEPPEPQPPRGPNLNPQLQRLLVLLTEFGGIYGTAAVVIAWFTNIDPFGALHWDLDHVLFGLKVFTPLMLLDAALMVPDYSLGPQDSQAVSGLIFGDPDAITTLAGVASKTAESSVDSVNASVDQTAVPSPTASADLDPPPSTPNSSSQNALLRLQMALELLQQVYTRANPGVGLNPVNEFVVVCVAALADEMLYRAVGLTLLGLWLRDRLYEAGFDETVNMGWFSTVPQIPAQMATPEFARYAAIGVIAGLGAAGFAAGALRELETIKRLQVRDKAGEASEASEALKAQLVASLGSQNLVMYGVEGVREVTASVMAGVAFIATGNLAAPLAGSIVVQTLFSAYQRLSLKRAREKRKAMLDKMKQRSSKLQAAMEAAVAAKQAAAEQSPAAAGADATAAAAADASSSSSSSSSSHGEDQQQQQQQDSENVDFLTAVLLEAERQQQQQAAASSSSNSHIAAEPTSSIADWEDTPSSSSSSTSHSSGNDVISSHVSSSSSSSSQADIPSSSSSAGADTEAAQQQLSILLEDMLRSPEGFRVVQRWMAGQNITSSSHSSSSSSSSVEKDPQKAVEQLLADPETKAKLLKELEGQLCALSELKQQRAKQEETWRR